MDQNPFNFPGGLMLGMLVLKKVKNLLGFHHHDEITDDMME